jgi:polyphosphate kinase
MNSLVDAGAINALYEASKAGVEIDLIIRGICCLRPGIPGISDRIRVISIVGRFLEHSRLWNFGNAGADEFYIGSADWMPRNFDRRVEAVTPVEGEPLHARLRALLNVCLADNRQAWELHSDGSWHQRVPRGDEHAIHRILVTDPWGIGRNPSAAAGPGHAAPPGVAHRIGSRDGNGADGARSSVDGVVRDENCDAVPGKPVGS